MEFRYIRILINIIICGKIKAIIENFYALIERKHRYIGF